MSQIITLTVTRNSSNTNVLYFDSVPTLSLQIGSSITGSGIPAGTYVATFTDTSITLSSVISFVALGTLITITSNSGAVARYSSDYKVKVPTGGRIILDTGLNTGLVFITGDLNVQGSTTTVNTTNMEIEDNILVLNRNELGSGVTLLQAGIEIDRGTAPNGNAQIFWIETTYTNPVTGYQDHGYFSFKTKTNANLSAIQTNAIDTNGQNLSLISKGLGVLTVSGTTNYEEQVLDYGNNLSLKDKDIIPNMQAVFDKINYQITNNPSSQIKRDDTRVTIFDNNIASFISSFDTGGAATTNIIVNHNLATNFELNVVVGSAINIQNSDIPALNGTWSVTIANPLELYFTISLSTALTLFNHTNESTTIYVTDVPSNVSVFVDGILTTQYFSAYTNLFNVQIENNIISTASGTDLILISGGPGSVQIQDDLRLQHIGVNSLNTTPTYAIDSVKIYGDVEGAGSTGIFYVGPSDRPGGLGFRRDELISKKKAIAFSILM